MKDNPIANCPECEGAVKRLLYPVGIVFKGSGWYINDSRAPEKSEGGEAKAAESKPAESGTESKSEPAPASANSDKKEPVAAKS